MKEMLKAYMKQFGDFTEEAMEEILKELNIVTYAKEAVLLEQGDIPYKCYFVLKGCVRQYGIDAEGREVTYEFYTEGQAVAQFSQFGPKKPSKYTWICVEECVLVVGDLDVEQDMYDSHDGLETMTRKMMEVNMGEMQEKNAIFVSDSPEERYTKLMTNREDLLKRVPQHQLASYLGITPESLSRIKRRIDKSKFRIAK